LDVPLNKPLILATDQIHSDAIALLAEFDKFRFSTCSGIPGEPDRLADADVIIVRNALPANLFDKAPKLKAVIRHGAGLDMIPVEAASRAGVLVANVPTVNANAVAEYVLGQMISLSRQLHSVERLLRNGSWQEARSLANHGFELAGKTVAIVGVGAVGNRVATICAGGFGMKVLGVHPSRQDTEVEDIVYVPLHKALSEADFVVLSCPLNKATENMLGAEQLGLMKPSAFIINVARGKVVNTASLCAALANKRIAGAALDVFETQPLPREAELLALNSVRLSPHVAGITEESMRSMSMGAARQALDVLKGKFPQNWINVEARDQIIDRWASMKNF
jgi:D-3-phosphoglycerate dehydrogenase